MVSAKKSTRSQQPVTVVVGGQKTGVKQPETFRVCPLGIQFYSKKSMPEFELIEFRIEVPGKNGSGPEQVTCTGVVVHSRLDKETQLYRVWIKFIDLPESKRDRIHCVAKESSFLCPYCENF
ncbi:MAG: hypothetical protein BWY59_02243 [Verrucomicrobia bacterium ADurb.Bin345]|nr:MAG: hypothetical protein BWY59_02243 [Verrucomicrobia bacterium ADurb.Bin345]